MEPRFQTRKQEMLDECQTNPEVFRGMLKRLAQFLAPFTEHLWRKENREHAHAFVEGLLSDMDKKNSESIAYQHDEDRQGLQHFIGSAPWDHKPLLDELNRQVAEELGEEDAVLVFDPSGFPKKGKHSVGVARQWLGRLGKVDNGQVGVFLGYVSRIEHALVDFRLYLPKSWDQDKERRQECGVPKEIRYRTRHQLALEMLDERGEQLPHGWVAGDDEMGRPAAFRRELRDRNERYLLAVPSNTTIRDLEAPAPSGRARKGRFEQVRRWCDALPEEAWTHVEVGMGEKGPLTMEVVKRRVESKTDGRVGTEEVLLVTRTVDERGTIKHDYHLSNADPDTPLEELARVAQAEHRIEQCIQRGKSDAGMADYQTRTWAGWHHHQTLCLLAVWFLILEARRGRKWTPAMTVPQIREGLAKLLHAAYQAAYQSAELDRIARERTRRLERNALAKFYHYKARNRLPPKKVA